MQTLTKIAAWSCLLALLMLNESCSEQPKQGAGQQPTHKYSPDDLPKLTGLVVPSDLPQRVQRTNKLSAQVVTAVRSTAVDPNVLTTVVHADFCDPNAATVDFRKMNLVSPVKDQKDCGACWAFATNAVLESSYLALRKEHIGASEQELISCSTAGSCSGGWWAFDFVMKPGIESDKSYAYEHADSACKTPLGVEFRALESGYVASAGREDKIPSESELKTAMCKHGPLAVAFRATPAFIKFGFDHHNQAQVFSETDSGTVNHGIVLVGWDTSKQAWIIKNSWSTEWGDEGFLYVKYGTNSIGLGAAWAEAWPKDYAPVSKVRKLLDTQLKSTAKTRLPID